MHSWLIFLRVILVLILALPAGFAFWMLSAFITAHIYVLLYELGLTEFNWLSYLPHRGGIREFLKFWHIGFGIYTLHAILYSILALILNFESVDKEIDSMV